MGNFPHINELPISFNGTYDKLNISTHFYHYVIMYVTNADLKMKHPAEKIPD